MSKYTMYERTVAQNKAFALRKKGYQATRIVKTTIGGQDKNGKDILVDVLTSFGYSKNRDIPDEINEKVIDKYNFTFIYYN